MGSGKSILGRVLLWADLTGGIPKTIAIVPQRAIGKSFGVIKIRMPDGTLIEWAPRWSLIERGSPINNLYNFVKNPQLGTLSNKIAICTHATFVRTHARLRDEGIAWNAAGEISLALDEAHLAKVRDDLGEPLSEDDEDDDDLRQGLGEAIGHWLTADVGPILLMTATWLRGDLSSIISHDLLTRFNFVTYQLTADRYLNALKHLHEVVFSFAIGTPEDVVRHLYADRTPKIIDFMRHPNMMDERGGDKYDRVARRLAAIGPSVPDVRTMQAIHTLDGGRVIKSVDLVTDRPEAVRKARQREFVASLVSHCDQPDYVATMQIGKLGLDWEECDTVLIDQKRTSLTDTIQMSGRPLRDLEGKSRAEIITVLEPLNREDAEFMPRVRDYLKIILASLVVDWQFRTIRLPPAVERIVRDPHLAERLIQTVTDGVIGSPDSRPDDEILDRAIETFLDAHQEELGSTGNDSEGDRAQVLREFLREEMRQQTSVARELHDADEVPDDILAKSELSVFGCVRLYAYKIGKVELRELRTRLEATRRIPFADLQREVGRLGIRNEAEYARRYAEIPGAPQYPHSAGYAEWHGWPHFFGYRGPVRPKRRTR